MTRASRVVARHPGADEVENSAQLVFPPALDETLKKPAPMTLAAAAIEIAGPNPTRADMLRAIIDRGRFDIGGDIMTFGPKIDDAPAKVFLTVIQPDGTFKPVEKL